MQSTMRNRDTRGRFTHWPDGTYFWEPIEGTRTWRELETPALPGSDKWRAIDEHVQMLQRGIDIDAVNALTLRRS